MVKIKTLDDLFLDEIRDLYDAEKQLTKALPKMAKGASSDELREAFESHLKETTNQVSRLEQIFEGLGVKGTGKKCAAMTGLIKEGEELMNQTDGAAVRDAGLIAAAQKVEHYEMSGYGSARTHAQLLGHMEAVSLLEETLTEEKEADKKLNDIAEDMVNEDAANEYRGEEGTTPRKSTSSGQSSRPRTRTAGS